MRYRTVKISANPDGERYEYPSMNAIEGLTGKRPDQRFENQFEGWSHTYKQMPERDISLITDSVARWDGKVRVHFFPDTSDGDA